jgi:hypothetical protein
MSSRACEASCHREARRDLVFIGTANREREIAALQSILSSRGTTRSRLYWDGKQKKKSLPRFRASCHREARRDLVFIGTANREKRDCRAALAMTKRLASSQQLRGEWRAARSQAQQR